MLRSVIAITVLCASVTAALADGSCKSVAGDKKLSGAAMNSFMKKCQTDAKATCETTANGRKLYGAAKASFTKKCLSDATGT